MDNRQIEEIYNQTFGGLAFFYRDTTLSENLITKYSVGQMLTERGFTDMSSKGGGLMTNLRYLIASAHAKDLSAIDPDAAETGHVMLPSNAFFKVLDIYKIGDKTQILLLEIPEQALALFSSTTSNIETGITKKAKEDFDANMNNTPVAALQTEDWKDLTQFPIGMSDEGDFSIRTEIERKVRALISTIILAICIFFLTSCSAIIKGIYGMKNPKPVDENAVLYSSKKYNIPVTDIYILDTSYFSFLASLDATHYATQKKNHSQPLQALYYDKTGQLISFQINCYTGGFPNLKWDRNDIMTTFPPKPQALIDSLIPLKLHLTYLKPLGETENFPADNVNYIVIVYWNKFMGRQSKRLVRFVQDNRKLAIDQKVKILFVNNDNVFGDYTLMMEDDPLSHAAAEINKMPLPEFSPQLRAIYWLPEKTPATAINVTM